MPFFINFDFIVNPFELTDMDMIVTVINDSVAITLERVTKFKTLNYRRKEPIYMGW